jgi:hypothetical protein
MPGKRGFMHRDSKAARKKPYTRPSLADLDANIAKAKLTAMGDPKDATVQKMLSFSDGQLDRQQAKSHS